MKVLIESGASVVGGCCGTTPAFIKALHDNDKITRNCSHEPSYLKVSLDTYSYSIQSTRSCSQNRTHVYIITQ